jgi:AmmeMemoRadiSam system protein A
MSPPFEDSSSSLTQLGLQPEYTPQERQFLLQIAHEAILAVLEGCEVSSFTPTPHLAEPRGVFATLYSNGTLRGCVGFPTAVAPLYRAVMDASRAAAFDDPRFVALRRAEAREVQVSLSILSPLRPISTNEVEVGRHGLVISEGAHRGLLLPQVPVEHGWDRITFLEQTCLKAGLPRKAWREGAKIEAFTAEVFGDRDCSAWIS